MRWSIQKNGVLWGCAQGNCHAAVDFILRGYKGSAGGEITSGYRCYWFNIYNDEYKIKIIDRKL